MFEWEKVFDDSGLLTTEPDPEMKRKSIEEYKKGNYITTEEFMKRLKEEEE